MVGRRSGETEGEVVCAGRTLTSKGVCIACISGDSHEPLRSMSNARLSRRLLDSEAEREMGENTLSEKLARAAATHRFTSSSAGMRSSAFTTSGFCSILISS